MSLYLAGVSATLAIWFPLSVIQVIDGLVFMQPWREVLRDIAAWWLLGLLPALLLALAARALHFGCKLGHVKEERAAALAWAVVLAPLAWICIWQLVRVALLWVRIATQWQSPVPAAVRLVGIASVLALIALLAWRVGASRLIGGSLRALRGLQGPALASIAVATAITALNPPSFVPGGARATLAGAAKRPAGPDIFLISLDSVAAADALVCEPDARLTPQLHRFAASATCFSHFYASSNFTTPTTSTMETGVLPWLHFAAQPDARVIPALRQQTLANALSAAGYRTHAITDNLLAGPRNRGTYGGYDTAAYSRTTLASNLLRDALSVFPDTAMLRLSGTAASFLGAVDIQTHGEVNPYDARRSYAQALDLLSHEASGERQFLWVHTLPPHSPYLPPPETKYKLLAPGTLDRWSDFMADNIEYPAAQQRLVDQHRLRYRESLMAADAWLGEFLDTLERQGRLDNAIVIVTADHGDSFEKGYLGHAGAPIHDALTRVPLLIRLPGQTSPRHVDTAVSQADLAPTLADLAGVKPLPLAEGRSLAAALRGERLEERPVFMMSMEHQSRGHPLSQGRFAVIDRGYKLVLELPEGKRTLYDLRADQAESRNLFAQQPATAARLEALLQAKLAFAEQMRQRLLHQEAQAGLH